jgi:hypothetical protein
LTGIHRIPSSRAISGFIPEAAADPAARLRLHRAEGLSAWLNISLEPGSNSSDPILRQSYRLTLPADGPASISAQHADGVTWALHTLAQLDAAHPGGIPAQIVDDSPRFAVRGVMLDVSRDRIPTMREFREIIRTLASLKFNHLQLYTEHTFAYRDHETVWKGWSPLTPDEVRRLDSWCRQAGIELAANQNCFGHMVPWLKHEKYGHLAETHGDWMFDIWPRSGPFSLCPTDPASLRFAEGLLDELLPCFESPWVNIGCDETYDIAYGRSRAAVEEHGRAVIYMNFVNELAGAVRSRGKKTQFWGDIALSHPDAIARAAPDLLPLAWGYEPNSPFEEWDRTLAGREYWVCPGTSTWRTITGRTSERKGNLAAAAQHAKHASGFLVCDWGDSGHQQQWPISLHALADAAQAAWNPAAATDRIAESLHLFSDATGRVAAWLDELGDCDLPLRETCGELSHPTRTRLLNQTALFIDMFKQLDEQTDVGARSAWFETLDRCEDLAASIPAVSNQLVADELAHTAQYACFAAARGAFRRDGWSTDSAKRLTEQLRIARTNHARLWRARSREGGLEHSDSFFAQVANSMIRPAATHGTTLFE